MSKPEVTADNTDIKDHTARRMQQLVEENSQLRRYVADVMSRLRENERLFSRLFDLETRVLAASDVEVLCFTLLKHLREDFELDMARFWIDRSAMGMDCSLTSLTEHDLVWLEGDAIRKAGLADRRVRLMRLSARHGFEWLGTPDAHLGSLALLTLGDLSHPFGVLGLGAVDADRFRPDQGTDFLQHLAQVLSLGLENAFSRERLDRLASRDTLTGGRDMRFLQPHSHQPLAQWFGKEVAVACLYLDVDGWKAFGERHGDKAADDVLATVGEIARAHTRVRDPLIRMSGDDIVLFLPGCTEEKAMEIAGRILADCRKVRVAGESLSVSIGYAYCPAGEQMQVRALIAAADRAMYVAKALGGGRLEAGEGSH